MGFPINVARRFGVRPFGAFAGSCPRVNSLECSKVKTVKETEMLGPCDPILILVSVLAAEASVVTSQKLAFPNLIVPEWDQLQSLPSFFAKIGALKSREDRVLLKVLHLCYYVIELPSSIINFCSAE